MTNVKTVDVVDAAGAKTGSVELPAEIFGVQTNVPLIHQVVVAQLAAARQGTRGRRPAPKYAVAVASPTVRREPVTPVRVRSALLSTTVVESCTGRFLAITRSGPPRR